jgi:hypothetical protein
MNEGEKKNRWYKKPEIRFLLGVWLGVWLIISYAISPKIATYSVYYDWIKPQSYAARIVNIPAVQFLPDGNLLACLTLELKPEDKAKDYSLVLPLKEAIDPNSQIMKKWANSLNRRGDLYGLFLEEQDLVLGCQEVKGESKIYLDPEEFDKPQTYRTHEPREGYDYEFLVGPLEHHLTYLDRKPLRRVRLAANSGSPEQVEDERYVQFWFPTHTPGTRWWNGIFFLVAIPIDAIIGPLEWVLIFNQHSRPYDG